MLLNLSRHLSFSVLRIKREATGFEKEKTQRSQVVKLPESQAFLLNAFRVVYAFSLDEKTKSNQLKTLISIDNQSFADSWPRL